MSFTSLTFWVFLLLVFAGYWLIRDKHWQNGLLLAASYLFYGWVMPWLAVLLGTSTLADFLLARAMSKKPERLRLWMSLSLILNVGTLAFFKYYNFFSEDLAQIAGQFGIENDFLLTHVLLPAGLSFFTLKKLSYMIDVGRGTLQPVHSWVEFALYVSFFPQLVAGPIERPQKLLPQLEVKRSWRMNFLYNAWPLIVMGLFKKIVIADSIKVMVDQIFQLQEPSLFLLAAGTLAFTLQILADFSGYTDMSRGVAWLLGFETSQNFNLPYVSLTPTDFWNRWHITLSNWLRDYIFFPVGRALRRSRVALPGWSIVFVPPLVTMFLSGLWHGAGWTFVLWGLYYGILICVYQMLGMGGNWRPRTSFHALSAWLVMFLLINLGWALFRAPSVDWLLQTFANAPFIRSSSDVIVGSIALSMVAVYSTPLWIKLALEKLFPTEAWPVAAYYAAVTIFTVVFINSSSPDFIYFQF